VFCSIRVREIVGELRPQFEWFTGHRLIVTFDVADALKRRIERMAMSKGSPASQALLPKSSSRRGRATPERPTSGSVPRTSRLLFATAPRGLT
jgi:hypothetical protein